MTSRDIIGNLFRGQGVDRVGLFEHFWTDTTQAWTNQGYPYVFTEPEPENERRHVSHVAPSYRREERVPENPYHVFPFDMHPCGGLFDTDPISGFEQIVEETDEWVVRKNGAGATFKYWKFKSGTPEHIAFTMTDRGIWESQYRQHLLHPDRNRLERGSWRSWGLEEDRRERAWGEGQKRWIQYSHVFVWEVMRQSLGDSCMYESLLLDPGWIKDFNRVYTDLYKCHFQMLFDELGLPDCVWLYDDLAYRNGLFASPQLLKELFMPYYAEINGFLHAKGLKVVLHSCGNITDAIPLIIDAGFDGLQPMEIKAGCDPLGIASTYGNRLVLIGGLDVRVLETNEKGLIKREVERLINGMKQREARYVFHSDHSITPMVRYDSYRYALDVYEGNKMIG